MTGTAWLDHDWGTTYDCPVREKKQITPIPIRYGKNEWHNARQGIGTDLTIQLKGESFTVHRTKLLAHSAFFEKMLTSTPVQTMGTHSVVPLENIAPAVLKALLRFLYTGTLSKKNQVSISGNLSCLVEILQKADFLQIEGMDIWASEFLINALKVKKKIPDGVFTQLFESALRLHSDPLLCVLLDYAKEAGGRKLEHAIGEASLNELITKEVWTFIKQQDGYIFSERIRNIEEINPLIRRLLKT